MDFARLLQPSPAELRLRAVLEASAPTIENISAMNPASAPHGGRNSRWDALEGGARSTLEEQPSLSVHEVSRLSGLRGIAAEAERSDRPGPGRKCPPAVAAAWTGAWLCWRCGEEDEVTALLGRAEPGELVKLAQRHGVTEWDTLDQARERLALRVRVDPALERRQAQRAWSRLGTSHVEYWQRAVLDVLQALRRAAELEEVVGRISRAQGTVQAEEGEISAAHAAARGAKHALLRAVDDATPLLPLGEAPRPGPPEDPTGGAGKHPHRFDLSPRGGMGREEGLVRAIDALAEGRETEHYAPGFSRWIPKFQSPPRGRETTVQAGTAQAARNGAPTVPQSTAAPAPMWNSGTGPAPAQPKSPHQQTEARTTPPADGGLKAEAAWPPYTGGPAPASGEDRHDPVGARFRRLAGFRDLDGGTRDRLAAAVRRIQARMARASAVERSRFRATTPPPPRPGDTALGPLSPWGEARPRRRRSRDGAGRTEERHGPTGGVDDPRRMPWPRSAPSAGRPRGKAAGEHGAGKGAGVPAAQSRARSREGSTEPAGVREPNPALAALVVRGRSPLRLACDRPVAAAACAADVDAGAGSGPAAVDPASFELPHEEATPTALTSPPSSPLHGPATPSPGEDTASRHAQRWGVEPENHRAPPRRLRSASPRGRDRGAQAVEGPLDPWRRALRRVLDVAGDVGHTVPSLRVLRALQGHGALALAPEDARLVVSAAGGGAGEAGLPLPPARRRIRVAELVDALLPLVLPVPDGSAFRAVDATFAALASRCRRPNEDAIPLRDVATAYASAVAESPSSRSQRLEAWISSLHPRLPNMALSCEDLDHLARGAEGAVDVAPPPSARLLLLSNAPVSRTHFRDYYSAVGDGAVWDACSRAPPLDAAQVARRATDAVVAELTGPWRGVLAGYTGTSAGAGSSRGGSARRVGQPARPRTPSTPRVQARAQASSAVGPDAGASRACEETLPSPRSRDAPPQGNGAASEGGGEGEGGRALSRAARHQRRIYAETRRIRDMEAAMGRRRALLARARALGAQCEEELRRALADLARRRTCVAPLGGGGALLGRGFPHDLDAVGSLRAVLLHSASLVSVPDAVGRMHALRLLDLSHNSLHSLDPAIAALPALRVLDAAHNRLHEAPPELWCMPQLRALDLSHNALSHLPAPPPTGEGQTPAPALMELRVRGNRLRDLAAVGRLAAAAGLPQLHTLDASDNRIADLRSAELPQLPQLRCLDLSANHLARLDPAAFLAPRLETLRLGGNGIYRLPSWDGVQGRAGAGGLGGGLPTLTWLDLSDNPLRRLPAWPLHQCPHLGRLALWGTRLCRLPPLPPNEGCSGSLRELFLHDCLLRALPPGLEHCASLRILTAHGNRLRAVPPPMVALRSLQAVSLHANRLPALPVAVASWPSLALLRIGDQRPRKRDAERVGHNAVPQSPRYRTGPLTPAAAALLSHPLLRRIGCFRDVDAVTAARAVARGVEAARPHGDSGRASGAGGGRGDGMGGDADEGSSVVEPGAPAHSQPLRQLFGDGEAAHAGEQARSEGHVEPTATRCAAAPPLGQLWGREMGPVVDDSVAAAPAPESASTPVVAGEGGKRGGGRTTQGEDSGHGAEAARRALEDQAAEMETLGAGS